MADQRFKVQSDKAVVEPGEHVFSFDFEPTGKPDFAKGKGARAHVRLLVDGKVVGEGDLPVTIPLSLGLGGGVAVGSDNRSPVMLADGYAPPFAFTGEIRKALVDVSGADLADEEAAIKAYLAAVMARQ